MTPDFEWFMRMMAFGIIFYCLCLLLTACHTLPAGSVCAVEAAEEMCWVQKSTMKGTPLADMEGHMCMAPDDVARVLRRLNDCQNTNVPVVGRPFDSLCVIEAREGICWIKKSGRDGRPFDMMEGFQCLDRPDMERILRRLNDCAVRRG